MSPKIITAREGCVYVHHKGGEYTVIALAEHSETRETLVVYRRHTDGKVYARPRAIFEDGRFNYIHPSPEESE